MNFRIRRVEAFSGQQIVLWLEDSSSYGPNAGATGPGDDSEWCVVLTVDEAPRVIGELFNAYAETMQKLAIEVAAGGCRTCSNTRLVVPGLVEGEWRTFVSILDDPESAGPCPVCIPRAETRIRAKTRLRSRPRRPA